MKKISSVISLVMFFYLIMVIGILLSCSQDKEEPLTIDTIRANFIQNVTEDIGKSSIRIDFYVDGSKLYMIDKSETATGLNIIVHALKKQGVWIEDSNNTLGHLGSSLMKLGYTHFVCWDSKHKKINTYELKKKT